MPGKHPEPSAELRTRVDRMLDRHPAVGLALGVVRDGTLELFHAHGTADIVTRRPVTEDTVFRVASITKTFTAIALMQLWEQGVVDLDAPANDYLRAYRLVGREGWRPATLRQLLTHTAGIGEQVPRRAAFRPDFGESVPAGERVPSLAEHYGGALRLDAEPGTRFRYGDHSPSTVGQVVEDMSGMPFEHYLRENVFEPLGMDDTTLLRSEVDRARLATGYRLRPDGPEPVPDRDWVTLGATSTWSTPRDMGRYLAALMGGGSNENGRVLRPGTLDEMYAVQYQPDPRIPGLGLAFWRHQPGGHLAVGHQGLVPGFDSQILVAPGDDLGVMGFTNGTFRGALWLPAEVDKLLRHLLGVPDPAVRADVPQRPEVWRELCGWYYLPGPPTDVRVRGLMGAGVEVFVREGRLHLRFLTPVPGLFRGLPLHPADPDDPYAFCLDFSEVGLDAFPLVFARDPATGEMAVHFELMPLTAYRQPRGTNPRLWTEVGLAAAGTALVAHRRSARRRRTSRS